MKVGPDGWIVSDSEEGEQRLASRVHRDLAQKVRMRGANAVFAAAAHAVIPELCDEIDRLRGLMAESPLLSHLAVDPGGRLRLEGTVPHWMAQRVAESFFETLADAENFVVVHFHSEQGPIEVTVRRPGGKPVATVQAEQLFEIARQKAEIARLKAALDKWESLGPWYAIQDDADAEPSPTGYVNADKRPPGVYVPLVCNSREQLGAEAEAWGCEVVPFPAPGTE